MRKLFVLLLLLGAVTTFAQTTTNYVMTLANEKGEVIPCKNGKVSLADLKRCSTLELQLWDKAGKKISINRMFVTFAPCKGSIRDGVLTAGLFETNWANILKKGAKGDKLYVDDIYLDGDMKSGDTFTFVFTP